MSANLARGCQHNDIQTDRYICGPPGVPPVLRFTCRGCGKLWGDEAEEHSRKEAIRDVVAEVRTWTGPVLSKDGQPTHQFIRDAVAERLEEYAKARGWS